MTNPNKKIPLVECFGPTVQGEGAMIGQQTYFLRFGLCDMRCKMCDSMHAVEPVRVKENARWLTQAEIVTTLLDHSLAQGGDNTTNWVTFSGGNPCMHDLTELCTALMRLGWYFAVETQGTLCPLWLHQCDVITVSPKGPGMGEDCDIDTLDEFFDSLDRVQGSIEKVNVKVVVFDQRDLEFAKMLIERYAVEQKYMFPFYLSQGNPYPPGIAHDSLTRTEHVDALRNDYIRMLGEISKDRLLSKVKFLPQFHVWLWANKQGV